MYPNLRLDTHAARSCEPIQQPPEESQVPTRIQICWDEVMPAGGTQGTFSQYKPDTISRHSVVRLEMVSEILWNRAKPGTFFSGIFDVYNCIHVFRPLNPRVARDEKASEFEQSAPMEVAGIEDILKNHDTPLCARYQIAFELGERFESLNITHVRGENPSHQQVIKRISTNARQRVKGEKGDKFVDYHDDHWNDGIPWSYRPLEHYRACSVGYTLRKKQPMMHQIYFQSQSLNASKFLRPVNQTAKPEHPETANVTHRWALLIRDTLQMLLNDQVPQERTLSDGDDDLPPEQGSSSDGDE